jgi:PhzF family phenazine biosynthesis protein
MTGEIAARFLQVDVFTARAGGGNPLGVVIGANDWSSERMQAFAAWTQLVETTFLLPSHAGCDYRLRIFTPQREIAFAGHPSIGSAHAALSVGLATASGGQLTQRCLAGEIALRVVGDGSAQRIFVQTPIAEQVPATSADRAVLDAILAGLPRGALSPSLISGGRRWWLAELADETSVRGWRPDHRAIAGLAATSDSLGLCLFARCQGSDHDLVVRAFPCGVGIDEDPASGAANGLIAAFLRQQDPTGVLAAGYRVSQGRELGRDASIEVQYDAAGCSWIGGQTRTVIDGTLHFPDPAEPSRA